WQATRWQGAAAAAAAAFTESTVAAVDAMAARADQLGAATTRAGDAVARARARLDAIVSEFEARAEALESRLDEPGAADELAAEARRALDDAEGVVAELRNELNGHQATVDAAARASAPSPPSMPSIPTVPMGAVPGLGASLGSGSGSGAGSAGLGGSRLGGRPGAPADLATARDARPLADPGMFGSGVGVQLPDGSTATAPNETAASAVRHALTQLGVPYDWGGTTPGVGLDCSGLTQWAYHEAGLDLPRLAQEQDVGSAVSQATLRPGDLAVWDGHVAMVVGNGVMIEAGDPVKLSPIRTTNAGQGFQGFWRPTA
ncbi:C40 family peptidase, partial [Mycobacterium hodleri]|uniref:C40 family peptidase n=1 Tax=Mycolicibacterium hodleri TaxID=49897 RepID=UPI0021F39C4D